jgi:3-methylfumaryl-CoA hydratase
MTLAQSTNGKDTDGHTLITRRQQFTDDWMRRITAMLDLPGLDWSVGDPVPFGWHFPLLGSETSRTILRADGFYGLGIAFPDIDSKRLVATGRTVESMSRWYLGQEVERTSRIAAITPKSTAQGAMTFVTVEHALRDHRKATLILLEKQTFLLLDTLFAVPQTPPSTAIHTFVKTIIPDATMLFQFSSLSFNSHKIHLDRDYARSVEGYPDLVVNGGLTTLFMTAIVRGAFGEKIQRLSVKNTAPLFCNRPIHFAHSEQAGRRAILAIDDEGSTAATMEFEIDD